VWPTGQGPRPLTDTFLENVKGFLFSLHCWGGRLKRLSWYGTVQPQPRSGLDSTPPYLHAGQRELYGQSSTLEIPVVLYWPVRRLAHVCASQKMESSLESRLDPGRPPGYVARNKASGTICCRRRRTATHRHRAHNLSLVHVQGRV
jgi:hypothetical protein